MAMPKAAAKKATKPFAATVPAALLVWLVDGLVPLEVPVEDPLLLEGEVPDGAEAPDAPVGLPKPLMLPLRGAGGAEAEA
jgi:hypothetical protein